MRRRGTGTGADTAVPLLDYVDRRCDDIQHAAGRTSDGMHREFSELVRLLDGEVDRRIAGLKEQIESSRAAMEHRLEGMNEFRDQLREQARNYITREVIDGMVTALRDQDTQQETRLRRLEGRVTADEGGSAAAARLKESRRSNLTMFAVVSTALLFLVSVALSVVIATHGG
jgi:hypothetical protein